MLVLLHVCWMWKLFANNNVSKLRSKLVVLPPSGQKSYCRFLRFAFDKITLSPRALQLKKKHLNINVRPWILHFLLFFFFFKEVRLEAQQWGAESSVGKNTDLATCLIILTSGTLTLCSHCHRIRLPLLYCFITSTVATVYFLDLWPLRQVVPCSCLWMTTYTFYLRLAVPVFWSFVL